MAEPMSRRIFLAGAIGTAGLAASCGDDGGGGAAGSTTSEPASTVPPSTAPTTTAPVTAAPVGAVTLPGPAFTLGIASGDPLPDRVVLWTRLAVDPLVAGGGLGSDDIEVAWDVATDDGFVDLVASGTAMAEARYGHSVHVDAGGLVPDRSYAYRFRVGGQTSPVGRTRTLPTGAVDRFSFVLATCQDPQFGEYGAWRDVAATDNLDAVVFTGDYIYELGPLDFSPAGDGHRSWVSPPPEDLDGFRLRYAQVKTDPSLQAAHAALPWFVIWDDHEITDNYWAGGPGQFDSAGGDFTARRAAAYQAWWEHQPVRLDPPSGGTLPVHRAIDVGDLVALSLLDTRQFADVPPCRDNSALDLGPTCVERDDPDRSILGADQEAWLLDRLGGSTARWNVVVSPVMFAGLDARDPAATEPSYYLESWDGYPAARERVADALATVTNPIVLSGDYHASFALDVGPGFGRDLVAPEFMSPAISSSPFAAEIRPANPHVRHFAGDNGYVVCTVTPDAWTTSYRTVTDVWDPASPVTTTAVFEVAAGDPQMREI